jgi:hypothetical protein
MEKITIKKQGTNIEIEINRGTTAKTILDGMAMYIKTISKMTNIPVLQVIEDFKTAMTRSEEEPKE